MRARRWDDDTRGEGVGDASQFTPAVGQLVAAMEQPGWVAEEPELHLLPHLERACASLPLELLSTGTGEDGLYLVALRWTGSESVGAVRAAVFSVAGSFAEHATYVRQRPRTVDAQLEFDVVTGILEGDGPFKAHGHTMTITVALP